MGNAYWDTFSLVRRACWKWIIGFGCWRAKVFGLEEVKGFWAGVLWWPYLNYYYSPFLLSKCIWYLWEYRLLYPSHWFRMLEVKFLEWLKFKEQMPFDGHIEVIFCLIYLYKTWMEDVFFWYLCTRQVLVLKLSKFFTQVTNLGK